MNNITCCRSVGKCHKHIKRVNKIITHLKNTNSQFAENLGERNLFIQNYWKDEKEHHYEIVLHDFYLDVLYDSRKQSYEYIFINIKGNTPPYTFELTKTKINVKR